MASNKEFTVSCLCGAATHTFAVPTSNLPLPTNLYSCNISRRISGTLLTSYVDITFDGAAPKPDLKALTPYRSSDIFTRYFCSTCGTHMYLEYHADGHFEVATGTFQLDSTDCIIDYKAHIWIEDTLDGGASQWIPSMNDKPLRRYLQEPQTSEEVPLDYKAADKPKTTSGEGPLEEKLHAHCHCGGVSFYISRPNAGSYKATSPFSDLIVPFHTGSSANPENSPWWLPTPTRYLAGTCACHSCRRALGFDITSWTFVPTSNISLDKKGTQPFRPAPGYWGTIQAYRSSEKVWRAFCRGCGANVFWNGDERPTVIDVATGLLDAPTGVRAEEWLGWSTERVSFEEDAVNKGLIMGLKKGLKEWAERNQGEEFVARGK